MTITFGSLFAGIGGIDLGLERAGMRCLWQVEIDDYCNRVLAKHWPDVARYRDVREVGAHNLAPVDLICGGFPCQPHSLAGKRRGAADDRNLWPEYRRIVAELQPTWVLAENVPGIRTTILDDVLSDLEHLAYEVGAVVVPAAAFGAHHRRERVYILAHANGREQGRRVVTERSEDRGDAYAAGQGAQGRIGVLADALLSRGTGGSVYVGNVIQALVNRESPDAPCAKGARCADVPHADLAGLEGQVAAGQHTGQPGLSAECDWWATEPNVGRVADGIPHRVDRLRCLGNAVVPQVAEWLGRMIVNAEASKA